MRPTGVGGIQSYLRTLGELKSGGRESSGKKGTRIKKRRRKRRRRERDG